MFSFKVILAFLVIQACFLAVTVKADFCDKVYDAIFDDSDSDISRRTSHIKRNDIAGIVPSTCDWETGTQEDVSLMQIPPFHQSSTHLDSLDSTCSLNFSISSTDKPRSLQGEGKKGCVAWCKTLFRNSDDCNDSRCLAWDGAYELAGPNKGKKKSGKCSCTCGCPNLGW
ncbi:uncharacterized protein BKCO1_300055 [Diplodia corticola]|uniref:Uncharacterized protein n=1 Tax=Diplodia corticola TaxID=236234 RepID=A0A1J9SEM0_9PEZI|nr:uncharacterized protein BKCO1_300055 [Diplodia corticola]OJD38855.1 hypothetical protein BKCO1_300055 [Diplodia corticola]